MMLCRLSLTQKPLRAARLSSLRCKSSTTTAAKAKTTADAASASSSSSSFPVVNSLIAAAAGIATVSLTAAAIEMTTASSCPPYNPSGQRYDQDSFMGRFSKMILQCDPRLLFYTQAQVLKAKEMIDNHESYKGQDRELWEASRLVQSALNDKGEFIPQAFRMSGYVPYNGPVCVAMLASQSTLPLLFWSWVNQSQNALVNYFNRNTNSPIPNETLLTSYAAAVGTALFCGFGLATWIQKRYPAAQAKKMLRWVAFPSTVVASSLNCYIMRASELETGIPLLDAQGQPVVSDGRTSIAAATQGVTATVVSRAILPAPVFFGPPLLVSVGPIQRYLLAHPAMTVPVTTFLLLTSFGIGLPATVAIFPQMSTIDAAAVEEEFRELVDPTTQQKYDKFYYNKGL